MHATTDSAALDLAVGKHLTLSPQIICYIIAPGVYGLISTEPVGIIWKEVVSQFMGLLYIQD